MLYKGLFSKKVIKNTEDKIKKLGHQEKLTTNQFLLKRVFITTIVFIISIITFKRGYILAPLFSYLSFRIYTYLKLDLLIKKRKYQLEDEAMYFFEVMTLALETGHGIKKALELTSENVPSLLGEEIKITLREMRFGKDLNEALDSLKERIPSRDINNILLNISEANTFGTELIETMNNQLDYLREKEVQRAKAKISKVPIKISIISVLLYIPLIMLLILGPVFLKLIGD